MKTKSGNVTYWILTLLVATPFLGSGIAYAVNAPPIAAGMQRLGYPPYLTPFIGIAKLLAVLAILAGRFPRLKEWAYAGLIFDTLGALYSHMCSGEPRAAVPSAVILVILFLSYRSWKKHTGPNETDPTRPGSAFPLSPPPYASGTDHR